jgi:homeobox-leucine zipper protein
LFEQLLDQERACDLSSRGCSDDEDEGGGGTMRKKLRLSKEQSALLEESFKDHSILNPV